MNLSRRELIRSVGAGALVFGAGRSGAGAATRRPAGVAPDFSAVRADFPRADRDMWLAAAETHPFSAHTLRARSTRSTAR